MRRRYRLTSLRRAQLDKCEMACGKAEVRSPMRSNDFSFLAKPPVLRSESERDFQQLLSCFKTEIQPQGIIEDMYVGEIAIIFWEILRLRRCKLTILNAAFRRALTNALHESSWQRIPDDNCEMDFKLLTCELSENDRERLKKQHERRRKVSNLANRWFSSEKAPKKVSAILRRSQQDVSTIEATAIRASDMDLDYLEKMLASLEARRDKVLRRISEYRCESGTYER
jgi:hypothetical protein